MALAGARYIGTDPTSLRWGDRVVAPGEIVTGPLRLLAVLLARPDFEAVMEPYPPGTEPVHVDAGSGEPHE